MFHPIKRYASRSFFACCIILSLFGSSWADYGKIVGRVTDKKTGTPLPGTNVMIESIWDNGKVVQIENKQGTSCDEDGRFVILNISPNIYNIKATMIGYTPLQVEQVVVNINRTITVNFELEQASIEMEAVRVVAQREVIKPDVYGTQEVINVDRLSETPIMRVDEFVGKIKGVDLVADNDGNGLSVRGGEVRETDVRIDGISARDPRSENSYLSLNSTSVAELQVLTGGFEAKYGGFRSGLVNVVTKEGSRDKISVSFKVDYTPTNDFKYFGTNQWSEDSWVYKIFADTNYKYIDPRDGKTKTVCYNGFAMNAKGQPIDSLIPEGVPDVFWTFKGWNNKNEGTKNYEKIGLIIPRTKKLTAEQKRKLWETQHPLYKYATKPDMYIEGTMTGPVPGRWIPLIGNILEKSTFMLGGKYENTQFAFPIGPRDAYVDYNGQLKITTAISPKTKISTNALYAKVETNTGDRPTSMGGALLDYSSRFNFLSNTQSSVQQQARILGSGDGYVNMFNRSRLQYLDQRWLMSGIKLNHTISSKAFFTLEAQYTYQDNEIQPYSSDTSNAENWVWVDTTQGRNWRALIFPNIGTPNSSTNLLQDISDLFRIYGGLQQVDSSYSWTFNLRGDLTAQMGRFHQIETGFAFKYSYSFVYSGTWYQSEKLWTPGIPDAWQYYKIAPIDAGFYLQDKLEFEGMIASVGLRADYFNPQKPSYEVSFPLDEDYSGLYSEVYDYLTGEWGSYERWLVFRELLGAPPGWPEKKARQQLKISPRLGVSFPITINSKLYFNYGHFYQRPNITFLYNLGISQIGAIVPSTNLEMGKTVAYEFGYEQRFLRNFLFNTTMYYKDVKNDPLSRHFIDYWQEFEVALYYPDGYSDIRGIEVRLEKSIGQFFTFWANYEYMLQSWGQHGLSYVYENRILAIDEERSANLTVTEPIPKAHLNVNFHTPRKWGPSLFGLKPLAGFVFNFMVDWKDGGRVTILTDPITGIAKKVDIVDYSNIDLRASKAFQVVGVNLEFVVTVANLLNEKRLYTSAFTTTQYSRYKESLHFPFESGEQHGHDKWGEWDKDYIDLGWFQTPLFLNPRRVLVGLRVNF